MSFLSPQQLSLLKNNLFDNIEYSHQNEMFNVGMSMIEATTIMEAMRAYDLEELEIN